MLMRAAIALILLLAGCANGPRIDAKPPVIQTIEVSVAVPVKCVRADQVPARPARAGPLLTGKADVDVTILGATLLRAWIWGDKQAAVISACVADQLPAQSPKP